MNCQPKISIITITFNSEKTLEETITSVVSQDYPNLEYLIIDGGSKDGTLDIIERYRDKIAYVMSEQDNGISDAFNKGINAATGEIIGIINSDDILLPGALFAVVNEYTFDVDVYRGRTVIWNTDNETKLSIEPTMEFPINKMIKAVCHQSTFVTKEAYNRYGIFIVGMKYMMDADLLHRFYNYGAKFKYIDKDLAVFRLGGLTDNSWDKKLTEYRSMMRRNGLGTLAIEIETVRFSLYNIIKSICFRLLGEEKSRKLRYY